MNPTKINKLFIITGASCVGKTTASKILFKNEKNYIVMDNFKYVLLEVFFRDNLYCRCS